MQNPRAEDGQPSTEPVSAPDLGSGPADQLAFEPLPGMAELDGLQVDLDEIDRVLVELDSQRPDRRESAQEAPTTA